MKIFVDSSILIEYIKGNRIDFYETLIEQNHDLYINQVVKVNFCIPSKTSYINNQKLIKFNRT